MDLTWIQRSFAAGAFCWPRAAGPGRVLGGEEKLRYIIQHPDIAKVVATKAYKQAKENFCAKPVTQGLIEFCQILKSNEYDKE